MEQIQLDPQHVIGALLRQITEQAQKIAMLEVLLEMNSGEEATKPPA